MPSKTCRSVDPVELLLRRILRRASLLTGTGSIAACASALDVDSHEALRAEAGQRTGVSSSLDASSPIEARTGGGAFPQGAVTGGGAFLQGGAPGGGTTGGLGGTTGGLGVPRGGPFSGCVLPDAASPADSTPPLGPPIPCESGNDLPIRAAGLKPAGAYDYLALQRRGLTWVVPVSNGGWLPAMETDGGWTPGPPTVLSKTGSPCATASTAQCSAALASEPAENMRTWCPMQCHEESIVTTRGDAVERWVGTEQLKRLLGDIDSPDEALLIARANGYQLTCDDASRTSVRAAGDGYELFATTHGGCPLTREDRYHLQVSRSGEIAVLGEVLLQAYCSCPGRKPAGLRSEARDTGSSALGDFLASCAHLEAASVFSFERLERELSAHGAPHALIEAARSARADEVRHAAVVGQLARARGGEPVEPDVESLAVRSLEEIALENVTEGCVRETFAALVAGYQAEHARDRELREALLGIAEDELRHAILAHRVQRWIATELDGPSLARIAQAKQRAVRELAHEAAQPIAEELQRLAGLPSSAVARAFVGELAHSLWTEKAPGSPQAA